MKKRPGLLLSQISSGFMRAHKLDSQRHETTSATSQACEERKSHTWRGKVIPRVLHGHTFHYRAFISGSISYCARHGKTT